MIETGANNLITDVSGLSVGHSHDVNLASGVTVILPKEPAVASSVIAGGAPGTRELDAIALEGSVGVCHSIVLSGGSAFGLDAATGVQSFLKEKNIGFPVGPVRVPIVPQAILFDLLNGGSKHWGRHSPYANMAYDAAKACGTLFKLGAHGAGLGATVAHNQGTKLRGGLGSASQLIPELGPTGETITVGALVAINAVGRVTIGETRHFWASPYEINGEYGGFGFPNPLPSQAMEPVLKVSLPVNTTLAVVATDAVLTQAQCHRLAFMGLAGMARAIFPAFTPYDGDIVFAISTGKIPLLDRARGLPALGAAASNCLARAIARGVYESQGPLPDGTPSYRDLFKS